MSCLRDSAVARHHSRLRRGSRRKPVLRRPVLRLRIIQARQRSIAANENTCRRLLVPQSDNGASRWLARGPESQTTSTAVAFPSLIARRFLRERAPNGSSSCARCAHAAQLDGRSDADFPRFNRFTAGYAFGTFLALASSEAFLRVVHHDQHPCGVSRPELVPAARAAGR